MTKRKKITNFYCNQKFTWLTVDLERRSTYSCCNATPQKIDLSWLKEHPGKIFNTQALLQERQDMLNNIPVNSCESSCWAPERNGLVSRRIQYNGEQQTHTAVESQPEQLNIVLGSTCNLTCLYCDKQYSTAWLRDIHNSGPYLNIQKFNITPLDQLMLKVSQTEHKESDGFNLLVNEVKGFTALQKTYITGGEPFLYNNFPELLNNITGSGEIIFYTGLGVNYTRLQTQLTKINKKDNLTVVVSAENINQLYEFNRHGNRYIDFCKNLSLLQDQGFKIKFSAVISNTTVHGLVDFVNHYGDENIIYQLCTDPAYLGINVLDPSTKERLADQFNNSKITIKDSLVQSLFAPVTQEQKEQSSIFIKEFAHRRNLSLDIFPDSMLQWLNIKDNHVV